MHSLVGAWRQVKCQDRASIYVVHKGERCYKLRNLAIVRGVFNTTVDGECFESRRVEKSPLRLRARRLAPFLPFPISSTQIDVVADAAGSWLYLYIVVY